MRFLRKRGFIEISFAWLFAIIAGAVILALAIFAASKIINLGNSATGAETQNQIAVLLNPLETSFQAGTVTTLTIPSETRIYNGCNNQSGIFGAQTISISQLALGKWSTPTNPSLFNNKYIFSDSISEGKQFYLFSKPFEFPFKISDVIYMTSSNENYCFANPPPGIQQELSNLNEGNILIKTSAGACPSDSIRICFNGENCDIQVNYAFGTVEKNGTTSVFYTDALMYGAIFADKSTYECQVRRLISRESQLLSLYSDKATTITQLGCTSTMNADLHTLKSLAESYGNSGDLNSMILQTNLVQQENNAANCKLW
ncbi:MAG: hypothetical protein KGH55_02710 [Nanoarchaeota archaeon]|nr:hypothetical protein [Nanoarchaeota archaeon]